MKRLLILLLLFSSSLVAQTGNYLTGTFQLQMIRDSAGVFVLTPAGKQFVFVSPATGTAGYWTRGTGAHSGYLLPTTTTDTLGVMTTDSLVIYATSATMTDGVTKTLSLRSAANNARLDFTNAHINFWSATATATGLVKFRNSSGTVAWGFGTNAIFGTGWEFFEGATNRMYIAPGGNVGLGTNTPQTKAHINGGLRSEDTLRVGNYTTYSYVKPGDALWTSSSDSTTKTGIRELSGLDLSKFSLVKPRIFRFMEQNFYENFNESSLSDTLDAASKAARRAAFISENRANAKKLSSIDHVGFLAQEYNQKLFGRQSKEIDYGELLSVAWLKIQELEARIKAGGL